MCLACHLNGQAAPSADSEILEGLARRFIKQVIDNLGGSGALLPLKEDSSEEFGDTRRTRFAREARDDVRADPARHGHALR